MNQMNQMKHSTGCWHEFENPSNFFYFDGCKGAFYVHFASCGSLICLYEGLKAVVCGVSAYLMNNMKVYEVRRFKNFFEFGLFCYGELMNIEKGLTSLMFIKCNRPPSAFGHFPQISLREYLGEERNGEIMDVVTGTSLVVMQFVALVRMEVAVHVPQNEFVTVAVEAELHVCQKCCVEGMWDVWLGRHEGLSFKLGRCRCCGKERTL